MDSIYTWLKIVAVALSIMASFVIVVLTIVGKVKDAKAKGEKIDIATIAKESINALSEIIENDLPDYIASAEEISGIPGAVKKVIVMGKVAVKCAEVGLDYQSNSATLSDAVDKLVSLTNKVNTNKPNAGHNIIEVK